MSTGNGPGPTPLFHDAFFGLKEEPIWAIFQNMKKDKPLSGFDRPTDTISEFSETRPISRKAVVGDFSPRRNAYLELRFSGVRSSCVELNEGEAVLGRDPRCHVQLQLPNVSRIHARVVHRNEEYEIEDLGSTNGTFLNGVQIKKCILRHNDHIQIGDAEIIYIEEKISKDE